ncbi:MAG: FecR domain-containing protein [Puniceicoccales bacterium]
MKIQNRRIAATRAALIAGISLIFFTWAWAQQGAGQSAPTSAEAAMKPAVALVAKVSGLATYTDFALGQEGAIEPKMKFKQGVTIRTGSDVMVVLLFSNGSALTIKPGSTVSIEEYLQSPTPEGAPALDALDREPSTSKTKLRLLEGDIVGSVKKLNIEEGSSYEVNSPIGTAGIRGTNYTLSIKIEAGQDAEGNFGISVGNGVFIPLGSQPITVAALQSVALTGAVNPDGSVTITGVQTAEMTEAQAVEVNVTAEQAEQLFEGMDAAEFNPSQGGVQGGEVRIEIDSPTPSLRVTPNQGE